MCSKLAPFFCGTFEARKNRCELKANCIPREELSPGPSGDNQEVETVGISLSIPQEIQPRRKRKRR